MLLENPNFLLFDEPTNDLDVMTLSVLEDFLLSFNGCVLIISHDRYFVDRVVDHLFIFDGKGGIAPFWGTYSDYAESEKTAPPPIEVKVATPEPKVPQPIGAVEKKKPLSFKEQQEFKKLEVDIETLESEKIQLATLFSTAVGSTEEFETAGRRLAEIDAILGQYMARWELLADRA
jgi:ATP-binding cassette subfamily F protein uup